MKLVLIVAQLHCLSEGSSVLFKTVQQSSQPLHIAWKTSRKPKNAMEIYYPAVPELMTQLSPQCLSACGLPPVLHQRTWNEDVLALNQRLDTQVPVL